MAAMIVVHSNGKTSHDYFRVGRMLDWYFLTLFCLSHTLQLYDVFGIVF